MGWKRKQKNRTENGPRWENSNPGAGCNATHVARARKSWRNLLRRAERRTGSASSASNRTPLRTRPSVHEGLDDYADTDDTEGHSG